jgi:glycosyltransferase involved in cell wall biosynthesis
MKKILIISPAINLDYSYGAIPYEWQLYKGLYEEGFDVIVIPYRGHAIRGLWWRCYENPCKKEGDLFSFLMSYAPPFLRTQMRGTSLTATFIPILIGSKWRKHILNIINKEDDIRALLIISIPLNHIRGLANHVKEEYEIPILYYDVDAPISFPKFGGFTFNGYIGVDLFEYDAFIIPSEDYVNTLKDMGARKVYILHFGVDPKVYLPLDIEKDIDVFFSGSESKGREKYLLEMITKPSLSLNKKFIVSGRKFDINLGKAKLIPMLPFNSFREYCCRSKISLNIARELHATTHTSTSRPFELASLKSCVVSAPYKGLDKWFVVGKEIIIIKDSKEAIETYKWLLDDEESRIKMGELARQRVLKEHTIRHRVKKLIHIIEDIS